METKKLKLLIADDHKLFNEGLKHVLSKEYNIDDSDSAVNGKEAIEKCLKHNYDVVIMDVNMPLINGIQACAEIKRHHPNTKIIFISMITEIATVASALKAGADAYVLKGNGHEDMTEAFKSAFKNQIFISEQLRHYFAGNNPNHILQTRNDLITFSNNIISEREKDVLKLICEGFTNEKIAEVLSISVRTVDTHRTNMLTKLKLPNTAALVKFVIENKLV